MRFRTHRSAFRAASEAGRRPARASGSNAPGRARFSPVGRRNPSALTAHSGRRSGNRRPPFAALNALQDAPFRFQSRERSGPQARESERFERPRAREALPCWTIESLRIDRSLWPSLCQSTAAVRGPERASGRTVPLSEPRAKRAAGPRERAVRTPQGARGSPLLDDRIPPH